MGRRVPPAPFSSPLRAQLWVEWRYFGWVSVVQMFVMIFLVLFGAGQQSRLMKGRLVMAQQQSLRHEFPAYGRRLRMKRGGDARMR